MRLQKNPSIKFNTFSAFFMILYKSDELLFKKKRLKCEESNRNVHFYTLINHLNISQTIEEFLKCNKLIIGCQFPDYLQIINKKKVPSQNIHFFVFHIYYF